MMGPPTYALDMVNPLRRQYMYVLSFPYCRGPVLTYGLAMVSAADVYSYRQL